MGRSVLINSVLDSQLVYLMSSLQLPTAVIDQLDKRRRVFLWYADKTGKAAPASFMAAWTNVCQPKEARSWVALGSRIPRHKTSACY